MSYEIQLVVDCTDPHALATWWAQTLQWQVEPTDEGLIRQLMAQGRATYEHVTTVDGGLAWRNTAAITRPGHNADRIVFHRVPEPKTVKNRLHLDVRVGAMNAEANMQTLIDRGATFRYRVGHGEHSWITMADPEGNEFCLI